MSIKIVVLFVLLVLLTIGGAVWARRSVTQDSAKTPTPVITNKAAIIAGYQHWTRVNPEPVQMDQQVAAMCGPAYIITSNVGPHRAKFITVYVNDLGRHAMTEELNPRFPVGTVIVKEKLPNKDATAAELLTVMRKRERGYDSKNGDWEYLMLDGPGRDIQDAVKVESCQSCHMAYKQQDYVTRLYLTPDTRKSLK
ncbi:MAG TPA: cytochrome P460 family protein [Pyrinomonadaceae bacterium]|nr:cytochrome P460 family protein [Pyrinomonadaceae bacterium]